MAEKDKKPKAKKTTSKSTAAAAPKSGAAKQKKTTRTAASRSTRSTRATESRTKTESQSEKPVVTHYTKEPSAIKLRLTNAASATWRTVRRRQFWVWVAGVAVAIFLVLVLWWQWQRSYVAVVGGQYLPVSMMDAQLRANYGNSGVNSIVQQQLILQEAARRHVTIKPGDIDKELEKVITSSGGNKAYQEQLKQLGIPETLLRQQIEVQFSWRFLPDLPNSIEIVFYHL